jgi:hypothetical protein
MDQRSDRSVTAESVRDEIARIQELLRRHKDGDIAALGPYSYAAALKRIQYLRHKQRLLWKKWKVEFTQE